MPAWLIKILINLAIQLGMPFLLKLWPGMPQSVIDAIKEALANIAEAKAEVKRVKKAEKAKCVGSFCPADTKGI